MRDIFELYYHDISELRLFIRHPVDLCRPLGAQVFGVGQRALGYHVKHRRQRRVFTWWKLVRIHFFAKFSTTDNVRCQGRSSVSVDCQ
eukprot:7668973-Pyramimonas_sp.AAC.1